MKVDFRGKLVCALSYSNGKVLGRYFKNESYSTLFNNRISQYKALHISVRVYSITIKEQSRRKQSEPFPENTHPGNLPLSGIYIAKTFLIFCA